MHGCIQGSASTHDSLSEAPENENFEPVRIDKFLWAVRLYKTRALATEACRGGHIAVNGQGVKPAREVKPGDIITAQQGILTRTVKVTKPIERRVGPKLVEQFIEDQTPASEYLKVLQQKQAPVGRREKGAGRPTKKDRRQMEEFLE